MPRETSSELSELDELVARYREAGIAEKLVGKDLCYERGAAVILRILRVLDITEKTSLGSVRHGPTFLCYAEASYGALVQVRHTDPDGKLGMHRLESIDELRENMARRRRIEYDVVPEEREGFADFVVGYAPELTGEAIGRPLTENDRLIKYPFPFS